MKKEQSNAVFLLFVFMSNHVMGENDDFRWSTNPGHPNIYSRLTRTKRAANSEMYKFNDNQINSAVVTHNEARRIVKPPATDMTEMSWDEELADLALDYSQKCVFEHNPTRRHSRFTSVGENIYISTGRNFNKGYVEAAIKAWDGEKYFYNYESKSCVPGEMCGHYTQVVWDSSFRVGCGAAKCDSVSVNGNIWRDATILVCNYGPAGNVIGSSPYSAGNEPCSECENEDDECRQGLCYNSDRLKAPEEAFWLEWSNWGGCDKTCGGGGRRYRNRQCSTYVLSDCEGYSRQYDPYCANRECSVVQTTPTTVVQTTPSISTTTKRIDETTTCDSWSSWTSCSATCGSGTRERRYSCVQDNGSWTQTTTYIQRGGCRDASC